MPVTWTEHDALRAGQGLPPAEPAEKREVEDLVSAVLRLTSDQLSMEWGSAIGYGLSSLAVVKVPAGTQDRYSWFGDLTVKVYRNAASQLVRFHGKLIDNPLPSSFQRTIDSGAWTGSTAKQRGYVVLQYAPGCPLDELPEPVGRSEPERARSTLAAFFRDLLIPTWSAGLRFFDFRAANLVLDPIEPRLVMIDTDALLPAVRERDNRPDVWKARDTQERKAHQQLAGLVALLLDRPGLVGRRRVADALSTSGLIDELCRLDRTDVGTDPASNAVDRLISLSDGWTQAQFRRPRRGRPHTPVGSALGGQRGPSTRYVGPVAPYVPGGMVLYPRSSCVTFNKTTDAFGAFEHG